MSDVWVWVVAVLGYGCVVVLYAANRGRKYLRFVVPGWVEPYRLWIIGPLLIFMGLFVAVVKVATDFYGVPGR